MRLHLILVRVAAIRDTATDVCGVCWVSGEEEEASVATTEGSVEVLQLLNSNSHSWAYIQSHHHY